MRYAPVREQFDPILPHVEKPGRYLGLERNVIRKDLAAASVDARARVSRHLRDRHVAHGLENPVRDRQPPSGVGLRAGLRAVGGFRGADAREGNSPLHRRVVFAGHRLRRGGIFAAGGGQLLQRSEHARPGGHPGAPERAPRNRSDRPRRRPVHREPRAARDVLRRVPDRRRGRGVADFPGRADPVETRAALHAGRSSRSRGKANCGRGSRRLCRAERGSRALPIRLSLETLADPRLLRPLPVRRRLQRRRHDRANRPEPPGRPGKGEAGLGREALGRGVPRKADRAFRRHRPGPPRARDHARLHAGVPVLPGGLLVPSRSRARSRRRRIDDEEVHRRDGLVGSRASFAFDRGLFADRAARLLPRSAALGAARVDLAPVPSRGGVLRRPRRSGVGGPQVGLHVRAGNRLRPPPPGHQQDVHERRHGAGGRRRVFPRVGPDQGLHDDRPPDRNGIRPRRARDARARTFSRRAGSTAARE